jgi:hypothetical protein
MLQQCVNHPLFDIECSEKRSACADDIEMCIHLELDPFENISKLSLRCKKQFDRTLVDTAVKRQTCCTKRQIKIDQQGW